MFTHIMVPLDGSELAERALPCAEHLARACGAQLHLVRVIDLLAHAAWSPAPLYVPAGIFEAETQQATAYLETLRAPLIKSGVQAVTTVLAGDTGATLLDYERDAGMDLVVMCSHGRTGLARFALGSVAERLLRYGTAPLLLVRAFGAPLSLAQAVVPLDGSARAEAALPVVDQLAGPIVREVTLLRVIDGPEQGPGAEHYLEAVAGRLPPERLLCHRRVEQGEPAERISSVAGADRLVVMATHGRTGLARWALGSVAERVAHSTVAGVLLVRAAAR